MHHLLWLTIATNISAQDCSLANSIFCETLPLKSISISPYLHFSGSYVSQLWLRIQSFETLHTSVKIIIIINNNNNHLLCNFHVLSNQLNSAQFLCFACVAIFSLTTCSAQ